jgi:hypothetical protein
MSIGMSMRDVRRLHEKQKTYLILFFLFFHPAYERVPCYVHAHFTYTLFLPTPKRDGCVSSWPRLLHLSTYLPMRRPFHSRFRRLHKS